MTLLRYLTVLAVFAIGSSGAALAQSHGDHMAKEALTVAQPWSRATAPSQQAGGVFLKIENSSDKADRLIGVESNAADIVELHTMIQEGDVMKMRPIKGGIEVPAKGHAELAPGGNHVMLIGLHGALVKGAKVPLTLIFEHAGRVEVEANIEGAGSRGPAGASGHGAHGGGHGAHGAHAPAPAAAHGEHSMPAKDK